MYANEVLGYVPPVTETNEKYIAVMMVQKWLDMGLSEATVIRKWNGCGGQICKGINAHGQEYDTEAYRLKALSYLR